MVSIAITFACAGSNPVADGFLFALIFFYVDPRRSASTPVKNRDSLAMHTLPFARLQHPLLHAPTSAPKILMRTRPRYGLIE